MNFIYLPTDNLYKFFFWFGALMVAFSFYLKQETINESFDQLFKQDSVINGLKGDEAVLKASLDYLEKSVMKRGADKNSFENRILAANQELALKQAQINNATARKTRIDQKYNSLKETIKTIYLTGIIAFSFGGLAWLLKIQIPQERIAALQQKLLEIELNEKQSPSSFKHLRPTTTIYLKKPARSSLFRRKTA